MFTEVHLNRSKSTLVVGVNGSGKSSITDALSFALYGVPYRDINKPQLVNSITGKHTLVEVEFMTDGNQYMIRRGIKPARFEIYKNGEMLPQASDSGDQQMILTKEILKLDRRSFNQIVVLGSANYTPFMSLKADHRRTVIEELLDIQIFTTMNSILKKKSEQLGADLRDSKMKIDRAKSQLDVHNQYVATQQEDRTDLIAQHHLKLKEVKQKIKAASAEIQLFVKQQDTLNSDIVDKEKVEKTIKQIVQLERSLEDKLTGFTSNIHFFESNDQCPTCAQGIDSEFKHLTVKEYSAKVDELTSALDKMNTMHQTASGRISEISSIVSAISEINTKIARLNTSISHHQDSITDLTNQIEKLKEETNTPSKQNEISILEETIKNENGGRKVLLEERELHELTAVLLKDSGIKTRIIKKYVPVINKLVNKYLSAMGFMINFELDENFKETIKSSFRDEFTYNSFSEGERQRIDISLMLTWRAVAKIRNSLSTNLLIMDETFDSSLDTNGVEDFLKIIDDFDLNSNLFVISHKDLLFDKFHSVLKFQKVHNFSQIEIPTKTME